jgi:L-arabonate dehydrase
VFKDTEQGGKRNRKVLLSVPTPLLLQVGNMPLPRKLLAAGVTDMVRISDGRMSGTAFGTVVLHVSPESAVGGPLAFVQTGDYIELDVRGRRLHLDVPAAELEARRAAWQANPPTHVATSGYAGLYVRSVDQAHLGADMDFLRDGSPRGHEVPRESH